MFKKQSIQQMSEGWKVGCAPPFRRDRCGQKEVFLSVLAVRGAFFRSRGAGPSFLLYPKLPNEKQNCVRNDLDVCNKSCRQVK